MKASTKYEKPANTNKPEPSKSKNEAKEVEKKQKPDYNIKLEGDVKNITQQIVNILMAGHAPVIEGRFFITSKPFTVEIYQDNIILDYGEITVTINVKTKEIIRNKG